MDKLNYSDKEKIKELWAYAFCEQEPFLSEYFDGFWKLENAVAIKENEEIAAALQLIPYDLHIRNKDYKASYIVGVSVAPQMRGKKYSTRLMVDALKEQKKRGEAVSLLIPFSYEFYKKLGYSLCYTLKIYETTSRNIRTLKNDCMIKRMHLSDYSELNEVYEKFCEDKSGYIKRTENDWKYIFFEHNLFGGYIYATYENGEISGYVSYSKSSKEIYVREIVYKTFEALNSLLGFVSSHFSGGEKVVIRTAKDNYLMGLLKEPKGVISILPTVMARISDVSAVLSSVDLEDFKIQIIDDLIPENSGIYEKKADGKVSKSGSKEFDASMGIDTLTELFMGYATASDLSFMGRITADEKIIKKLDKLFPLTNNYINHIMEA